MPRKPLTKEEKARRKHEKLRDEYLSSKDPGYKFKEFINVPKKKEKDTTKPKSDT